MYCLCPDTEYKKATSGDSYINTNSQSSLHITQSQPSPSVSPDTLNVTAPLKAHYLSPPFTRNLSYLSRTSRLDINHLQKCRLPQFSSCHWPTTRIILLSKITAQLSVVTVVVVANILRDVRLTLRSVI